MGVGDVPFDLVGVKLAAPAGPGTVAKADAIGRLCASTQLEAVAGALASSCQQAFASIDCG